MAAQLGLAPAGFRSARRQQGLLYIYRTQCAGAGCGACPLAAGTVGQLASSSHCGDTREGSSTQNLSV